MKEVEVQTSFFCSVRLGGSGGFLESFLLLEPVFDVAWRDLSPSHLSNDELLGRGLVVLSHKG